MRVMVLLLVVVAIAGGALAAPSPRSAQAACSNDGVYDAATFERIGGIRVGRDWLVPWWRHYPDDGRYGLGEPTDMPGCWIFFWPDEAEKVMNFWIGKTNPPQTFCYIKYCIPNFWNGRGYVVMCADGMFSKSGGIWGACNYHGGVVTR